VALKLIRDSSSCGAEAEAGRRAELVAGWARVRPTAIATFMTSAPLRQLRRTAKPMIVNVRMVRGGPSAPPGRWQASAAVRSASTPERTPASGSFSATISATRARTLAGSAEDSQHHAHAGGVPRWSSSRFTRELVGDRPEARAVPCFRAPARCGVRGRQDPDGATRRHRELSRRPSSPALRRCRAVSVYPPGSARRVTPITHAGAGGSAAAPVLPLVKRR